MSSFREKADNAVFLAAAIGPMGVLTFIVCLIGIVKCSVTKPPDVAEHSINKTADIVENMMVFDSTNNGFRVVYATAEPVTNEKYEEICSRPNIK